MKKLLIFIFVLGLSGLSYAQASLEVAKELELEGITLMPANLSYLSVVSSGVEATRVINLQRKAASYNITKSPVYDKKEQYYEFSFDQKDDNIFATYDRAGRIVNSRERYKDIILSPAVRNAVFKAYPGWDMEGNSYSVFYTSGKDPKKIYKLHLRKGDQKKRIKCDANGKIK